MVTYATAERLGYRMNNKWTGIFPIPGLELLAANGQDRIVIEYSSRSNPFLCLRLRTFYLKHLLLFICGNFGLAVV